MSDGFDPFFAPRSGRSSEDPFKGNGARQPGNAPGGDPFAPDSAATPGPRTEGKRSPTISVEIPTDPESRRKDINHFQLSGDVRQLYDAWSFSIPNPEGRFNYLLGYRYYPIAIWESDPSVQGGADIPQLRGVITNISQDTGDHGSILHLSGYDLGYLLTSCAPFWYNLKGKSWQRIATDLVDKSWQGQYGFRAIVGVNFNDRLKQGRSDAEMAKLNQEVRDLQKIQAADAAKQATPELRQLFAGRQEIVQALFTNIKALTPKIQIQPGETVGDVLTRYARLAQPGRFVGVSALGDLMFFRPDYKQQPTYVFHWHWDPAKSSFNNILSASYSLDGEPIYHEVSCVSSRIYPVLLPNQDDPNEGKIKARHVDNKVMGLPSAPFLRRQSFADSERWNDDMVKARATWRFQQNLYEGETLTLTVDGHSQNGIPFVEGTRAEVHDTKNGIDKVMYVSRVDKMQDVIGGTGTTSRLILKPDGVLAP